MRGGSLTRYHTPVVTTQEGKGLAEDLIKISGPVIVQQAQGGLISNEDGVWPIPGPIKASNSHTA